jgi:hypothetical protein
MTQTLLATISFDGILEKVIGAIVVSILTAMYFKFKVALRTKVIVFPKNRSKNFSVAGKWYNELRAPTEIAKCTMILTQTGTKITGTLLIHLQFFKKGDQRISELRCTMSGECRDGIVILQGVPSDNTFTFNCGIFTIKENGQKLEGSAIRIHNSTSTVFIDQKIDWERMG